MKKNFIYLTTGLIITLAITLTVIIANQSYASELVKMNIEAITNEETPNGTICYYESEVRVGYTYYDCQTCMKVYDEKGRKHASKCNF